MLQSLKEMAAIENAEQLRANLSALQKSASNQLLQSWKGFQQLSNMSMSSSVTPECTRDRSYSGSSSEEEEIQGFMEQLGVPDRVRDELAAFQTQEKERVRGNPVERSEELFESRPEKKVNSYTQSRLMEEKVKFPDDVLEDVNTYVKFVIEKAVYAHSNSEVFMPHSLLGTEKEIKVVTHEQESNSCPMERIQQADYILNTNICEKILEEKQQRTEEKDIKHNGKQEIYANQEVNMKEIKDGAACEQSEVTQGGILSKDNRVEEDCIMETDTKYFQELDSNKEMEEVKDLRNASEMDNGRITEVYPKLSESSQSKEGLTSSEEEKSSFEDSCGEEHMNFSEDQVSDKEENLQINPVNGLQKKYSMIESQAKWQSEGLVSQACMQLDSKTECVKKNTGYPEMQTTSLPAVCLEHETRHQTEKIYSEEKQVVMEEPECYTVRQENIHNQKEHKLKEAAVCEKRTVQAKKKSISVAKFVSNLETCTQRPSSKPEKSMHRFVHHTEVSDPDNLNNVSLTDKLIDTTSEVHSSSLAFSYDSQSSSLPQEPERSIQANRVKFIRDMFLAKSQTRTQNGQRQLHSQNSDLSDSQPESTDSGGNWSQETSSGEDDTNRLAIAKGFVRKTIERLYGRGNSSSIGADNMRSPSALKAKQREGPGRTNVSSLASYHEARTRVTDVSYFSATNASDILNAPTACITLNEREGSGDANRIEKGHWLLAENHIRESSPELQEGHRKEKNNKTASVEPEQHSGQEDSFHGILPSSTLEKWPGSSRSKFTYFNLPNASDSDLEPEEKREVQVASETQVQKTMAEINSLLPTISPSVLKKGDNKVHPLTEATTPTVVTQPVKGQSAQTGVIKQSAEPDALEMLFVFCGQHCPIL